MLPFLIVAISYVATVASFSTMYRAHPELRIPCTEHTTSSLYSTSTSSEDKLPSASTSNFKHVKAVSDFLILNLKMKKMRLYDSFKLE